MVDVSPDRLGALIDEATDRISTQFLDQLNQVIIQAHPYNLDEPILLELCEGIPPTECSNNHQDPLDQISLYRDMFCRISRTEEELVKQIRVTLLHGIGYHFGLEEEDLDRLGYGQVCPAMHGLVPLSFFTADFFPVALITMSDNSSEKSEIRVDDRERNAAMERLGNYFADGYLGINEPSKRIEAVTVAKTRAQLQTLFADLPAEISPESSQGIQAKLQHQSVDQELQTLMKKGRQLNIVNSAAGVIVCVSIVLMLFTDIDNAWFGFVVAAAVALIGRAVLNINNDEEELLNEINEEESKRYTERLRLAAQKRREIQEGQQ